MYKKVAAILLFMLILSGCSGQGDRNAEASGTDLGTRQGESVPVAAWEEYGMEYISGQTCLIGDTVYTVEWENDDDNTLRETRVIRLSQRDTEGEVILSLDGGQQLRELLADEEGSVYTLYTEQSEDGEGCFIRKNDSMGNMVYCEAVPLTQDEFRVDMGIAGPGGKVVFCTDGGAAYFFDSQGRLARKVGFEWDGWDGSDSRGQTVGLVNAENKTYLYQVIGKTVRLREVDMENGSFGPSDTISMETSDMGIAGNMFISLFSGYGKGVLLSLDNTLWRYSPETGEKEAILNWGDKYINLKGSTVEEIGVLQDEGLYVLSHDFSANTTWQVLIQEKGMEEVGDNHTIVIGCVGFLVDDLLEDTVAEFNQENTGYLVEIRTYSDMFEFYMALLKGEGPDIFDVLCMPKDILTTKGLTEDLSPYFEASDVVKESDLLPRVREAGYAGGKMSYVIPSFSLHAYIVEKGYAGDYGWTAEDFLALADKYPDGMLTGGPAGFTLLTTLSAEIGSYINWEGQECSFNSECFVNLLESLKGSLRGSEGAPEYIDLQAAHFHNKEVLVYPMGVSGISEYLLTKETFLDHGELIGLPNQEGKPFYQMSPTRAFAINSASGKKEGAWEFLEFLLSEKYQSSFYSLPARSATLESWLEREKENLYKYPDRSYIINRHTGEERVYKDLPDFTDADWEFIRFMIDNAYWEDSVNYGEVNSIIVEEAQAFFTGDKTAKDVADIIQSRILLYLKE